MTHANQAKASTYEGVFQRYSTHRPTGFDHNINIDDEETVRSSWFKMPVSRTRDSGPQDNSNFETFLAGLGGESETVEVHRFGHWGPGWYEIIIVSPDDEKALSAAYDMSRALENHPILDEEDLSKRELEDFVELWNSCGCREFCEEIGHCYKLSWSSLDALYSVDKDVMRAIWTEVASEPYVGKSCGVTISFSDDAIRSIGRKRIAALIRSTRK